MFVSLELVFTKNTPALFMKGLILLDVKVAGFFRQNCLILSEVFSVYGKKQES